MRLVFNIEHLLLSAKHRQGILFFFYLIQSSQRLYEAENMFIHYSFVRVETQIG